MDPQVLEHASLNLRCATAHLLEAARCAAEGDRAGARLSAALAAELLNAADTIDQKSIALINGDCRKVVASLGLWRVRKVIVFVEEHLAGKIYVKDLAQLAGMCESNFMRVFKQCFAMTVHTYVRSRRIALAKQLMLTSGSSLSDIALSCGMADQTHFSRVFVRVVGIPPGRWRRLQPLAQEGRGNCGRGQDSPLQRECPAG